MAEKSINQVQDEIIEDFSLFEDWMMKYEQIIDLGKELSGLADDKKTEDRLVKGCQSQVWLDAVKTDRSVRYYADSDAIITKGLIALLVQVLDDQPAEEIVKADLYFIDQIGLKDHLSPNRSNGLSSMVTMMKAEAAKALLN